MNVSWNGATPTSSIWDWDIPWNKPSSYSGIPHLSKTPCVCIYIYIYIYIHIYPTKQWYVYFGLWIVMQKIAYPLGTLILKNHHIQWVNHRNKWAKKIPWLCQITRGYPTKYYPSPQRYNQQEWNWGCNQHMLERWALPTLKSNFWREKKCPMLDVKNLLKPFFPMVIIGD